MESSSFNRSSQQEEEEINVYFEVSKKVCLNIKRSETIRNVKAMLCEKEGISECLQELCFNGDHLKDAQSLVDCGIHKNSTVQVFVQKPINLFIKMLSAKKTITVEAKHSDTIQNIKTQIREKEGVCSDQYTLISAGKLLDDNQTIECLNIQGGSTLHMLLNPKEVMLISVKMRTGEILKPEVKLLHTIRDVKTILESMVGSSLDDMVLTYAGKQLGESKTVSSLNIKEESILEMLPPSFPIFIKSSCGKTLTFDVHRQDIIKYLKGRILQKIKVPTYFQLMFEGKRLEDDRDLDSYNIQGGSTLHMLLNPKEVMLISVKMRTGEILKPEVKLLHTIRDVKTILESMVGSSLGDMVLTYAGKQLGESKTVSSLNIKEESILEMLPPSFPIFIKSSCGKTLTFDVHRQDIIKYLKGRILQKIKVPTYFQLMFEGKRLEDDRDLDSYNIQSDCTLHLFIWPSTLIRRSKLSTISITGTLDFQDSTTINDLKKKIQLTMDKPVRELIMNGKALENQRTIGDYGIKESTVIDVALEVQ